MRASPTVLHGMLLSWDLASSITPRLPNPAPKQRLLFLLHALQHPDLSSL